MALVHYQSLLCVCAVLDFVSVRVCVCASPVCRYKEETSVVPAG